MKISDILTLAKKQNKILEAELLLGFLLNQNRVFVFANHGLEIDENIYKKFQKLWLKISDNYPLAYITKLKEFYGREFYVDERVLIPRPETECLVEEVMKAMGCQLLAVSQKVKVIDIGAGSGCIGISVALELMEKFGIKKENLKVILSDISREALEVAKINVDKFGLKDITKIREGDLLSPVMTVCSSVIPAEAGILDPYERKDSCENRNDMKILVANLPYIGSKKYNFVQNGVKKHEPGLALFSGDDGLDSYRKLFEQIKCSKIKFNLMAYEFGDSQKEAFEALIKVNLSECQFSFYKDLAGLWRGVIA
ncbi:MAG: S-adenosylmethionine-dependent methyltransferase, release factor glutamine methyltransferase [Candidatus Peregrinibacteria bacterium GW2011_GWF2_33_10]|nr:MAG: S-adenosylmethionine-dependent methyltransferase, release factor glutamine methyltransferase [Candidatus Peregrinibacteria bacterium GW2011_GWF2_33_10]OGJ44731.1 MAG: protein-(glutamine-N5) methyltransferase, release factor-specific [Candidatus Peregrinibacteria bacterium RIFOXYA2_FULL_33_21]OGJ47330.1 MAG: protein-(glutamine-N5) methyltransferase, release factor-specific [Candidatus Peregrinibacteria bacterium RIFOXYA12_FULL_33_12]OGJ50597.1 MAG: protein-(glutamine-N5) methyltransferase